jgi:hypothetical protein
MKTYLVVGSTYVDLDQYKRDNNLYTKSSYYIKEGVGEFHFINHNDPNLSQKLRGLVVDDLILIGDPYLDPFKKGEIYSRVR